LGLGLGFGLQHDEMLELGAAQASAAHSGAWRRGSSAAHSGAAARAGALHAERAGVSVKASLQGGCAVSCVLA
jgi:hypothetical protein